MEKYNILNEDVYASNNIDELYTLYSGKREDRPLAIVICINGEICFEINGKEYRVQPNQLIMLGAHTEFEQHTTSNNFKGTVLYINKRILIDNLNLNNALWENAFTLSNSPIISINDHSATIFECYGKLFYLSVKHEKKPYKEEIVTALIKALMFELLNTVQESSTKHETPGKHLIKQGDILFKNFIKLLSGKEVKPRMVSWYAHELCVTPKYLSTTCKVVSGKTANKWINEFVVRDIHKLLKYSDKSIKEICESLDFPNLSFFGKYVKAHLGYSPKEYRKKIKNA